MNDQVQAASRAATRTGRILGAVFCLVFVLLGLTVAAFIGHEVWLDVQTHFWTETDCRVVRSEAGELETGSGAPYVISIRFEYQWGGKTYLSDRVFRRPRTFPGFEEADAIVQLYPIDRPATCRVNPVRPGEAILVTRFPWMALALLVPLFFVAIGSVGLFSAIRHRPLNDGMVPNVNQPISSRGGSGSASGCLFVFFLLFFAISAWVFHLVVIRPVWLSWQAQSWPEVSCTILSSHVQVHSGSKGSTYSVDIFYEYEVAGRSYRASRYNFMTGSSSGRSDKEAIVRRYPRGLRTVCYVNPLDPTDAVLFRGIPGGVWIGLVPGLLMVGGAAGIWYSTRRRPGPLATPPPASPADGSAGPVESARAGATGRGAPEPSSADDEPLELRSASGRLGRFFGALIFTVFWNGVVLVFLWPLLTGAKRVSADWFLAIFLIPFVLIGLGAGVVTVRNFLGLFAPRVQLTLARRRLRVGESVDLEWQFTGRVERLESVRIYLEGQEEATYRRGTNRSTDRHVFAEIEIASILDRVSLRSGQARVVVPADTVPSLASANNGIVWSLRVKGVIRNYPDVDDSFVIKIGPRGPAWPAEKGTD